VVLIIDHPVHAKNMVRTGLRVLLIPIAELLTKRTGLTFVVLPRTESLNLPRRNLRRF